MTRKYIRRAPKNEVKQKRKYTRRAAAIEANAVNANAANADTTTDDVKRAAPVIRTEPELRDQLFSKLTELNRIDGSLMALLGPAPRTFANEVLAQRLIAYVNNILAPELIAVLDQVFIGRGYVLQTSTPTPEAPPEATNEASDTEPHPADVQAAEAEVTPDMFIDPSSEPHTNGVQDTIA